MAKLEPIVITIDASRLCSIVDRIEQLEARTSTAATTSGGLSASWSLYVWRDVLCDYTCGMAFALAPNLEEAINAAKGDNAWVELGVDGLTTTPLSEIDGPIGAYVSGGG